MSTPLIIHNTIDIKAPAAKVWDALVNPEQTKKYMFGCVPVTDWQPGSPMLWKGVFDGVEIVAVKGEVVKIVPGKHLSYTTIDPNSPDIPDVPENYLLVTYNVAETPEGSTLTVTQGDYAGVANGQRRYEDSTKDGGWQPILEAIRDLAEKV